MTAADLIERLATALRPFANIALEQDCNHGGIDMISGPDLAVTADDVRRARDAYSEFQNTRRRARAQSLPKETG